MIELESQLEPRDVAEAVRGRASSATQELTAYWVAIQGDRERFAEALRIQLKAEPVAVLVIRGVGFDNPNSILNDLIELIKQERALCEDVLPVAAAAGRFSFVLISRIPLTVSQASSPVVLPDWLSFGPTRTVSAVLQDISYSADGPLNTEVAQVSDLSRRLYFLEDVLIKRLAFVRAENHSLLNAFVDAIRNSPEEKRDELLSVFTEAHRQVASPEGFRPSLRDGKSLIARLWRLHQTLSPDELQRPAKALAAALALGAVTPLPHESLATVLRRSLVSEELPTTRLARNVLVTIGATCQYVTAAAHADGYDRYPVILLRVLSYDLRHALLDMYQAIDAPDGG